MIIGGLQKLTLIDYPGKLACTIFNVGCNFRCPFCYNAELVLPEKAKKHPRISEKDFFFFLGTKIGLLEGVCITGGEPCLQDDLPEFIKKIRELGFKVKLDTNGSNPAMLEALIDMGLIDYAAMDIKAPREKYGKIIGLEPCGASKGRKDPCLLVPAKLLENIERSISLLKGGGVDYEFRTTVIPVFHKKEDIIQIARWIAPAPKYFLQNFRPEKTLDPEFQKIKPYAPEVLMLFQKAVAPFFEICKVR